MAKLPFLKFFPNDWLAEPTVRVCSVAARGLWMDMLSLMHLSPRRGYLLAATGSPISPEHLARLTGCSADEVTRLLAELRTSGVFNCTDDGLIYSRRMVRDESVREKCRDAGRRGGLNSARSRKAGGAGPAAGITPPLEGEPKGHPKGVPKGRGNLPEARGHIPEARPPLPPAAGGEGSVGPAGGEPFDPLRAEQEARKLFERRWAAAGLRPFSRLTHTLHTRLAALLLDAWWAEHYPAALDRAGRIPFLRDGAGRQKGSLDVSEFLRDPDEVRKILDGVYDPRPAGPAAGRRETPEEAVARARREKAERDARDPSKRKPG